MQHPSTILLTHKFTSILNSLILHILSTFHLLKFLSFKWFCFYSLFWWVHVRIRSCVNLKEQPVTRLAPQSAEIAFKVMVRHDHSNLILFNILTFFQQSKSNSTLSIKTSNNVLLDLSKLEPLNGTNYRRWSSQKLLIFFEQLEVDYVLTVDPPFDPIAPSDPKIMHRSSCHCRWPSKEGVHSWSWKIRKGQQDSLWPSAEPHVISTVWYVRSSKIC